MSMPLFLDIWKRFDIFVLVHSLSDLPVTTTTLKLLPYDSDLFACYRGLRPVCPL